MWFLVWVYYRRDSQSFFILPMTPFQESKIHTTQLCYCKIVHWLLEITNYYKYSSKKIYKNPTAHILHWFHLIIIHEIENNHWWLLFFICLTRLTVWSAVCNCIFHTHHISWHSWVCCTAAYQSQVGSVYFILGFPSVLDQCFDLMYCILLCTKSEPANIWGLLV